MYVFCSVKTLNTKIQSSLINGSNLHRPYVVTIYVIYHYCMIPGTSTVVPPPP